MAHIRKDFRHKIIKNFFNKVELKILQAYCNNVLDKPSLIENHKGDKVLALHFYGERIMDTMLEMKKELVEKECGLDLYKTYTYWRWYGFGSSLAKHTDRPACEISITACIYKTDDWPLVVGGNKLNSSITNIELEPGDALLYLGVEESHGRVKIFRGDGMAQVFMHYVDKNGPFKHHEEDMYLKENMNKWSKEDKEYVTNLGLIKPWKPWIIE